MRVWIDSSLNYHFDQPTDVLLAVEALAMAEQTIVEEHLTFTPQVEFCPVLGAGSAENAKWIRANGDLIISYRGIVDVNRPVARLPDLPPTPHHLLPSDVIQYLFPSRYCEADRFENFVHTTFGGLSGGAQVSAMSDWINQNLAYVPGASSARTSAADTFMSRQGVCRDYAHLMISFARAVGIPARMVSVYAPGIEPPDFHAIVDVWLDGDWRLIDPSGLSDVANVVRIAHGRDATDISFMTIFGAAELLNQSIDARLSEMMAAG